MYLGKGDSLASLQARDWLVEACDILFWLADLRFVLLTGRLGVSRQKWGSDSAKWHVLRMLFLQPQRWAISNNAILAVSGNPRRKTPLQVHADRLGYLHFRILEPLSSDAPSLRPPIASSRRAMVNGDTVGGR
jgi:hypothetical protein